MNNKEGIDMGEKDSSGEKPKTPPPGAIKPLIVTGKLTELSESGKQFEKGRDDS